MRAAIFVLCLVAAPLSACATLADAAPGDEDLPNAGAGPFRELRKGELGGLLVAPNVVADSKTFARDATVIDADGDPSTFAVIGYFGANDNGAEPAEATTKIQRGIAYDGRSFERGRDVVLTPIHDWEGGRMGSPSAIAVGGQVYLYYAARDGIGVAVSSDGIALVQQSVPALAITESGWDANVVPDRPSVVALDDGSYAMFYEVTAGGERVIGEARSEDGLTWTRVGDGPVLRPGEPGDEAYDDAGVGAPCAVAGVDALGRPLLRLYYAAESGAGKRTIGLAGRYEDGAFERAASPVMGAGTSRQPQEPSAIVFDGFTLLFATQDKSGTQDDPVVAVGVAPAQAELPPPTQDEEE